MNYSGIKVFVTGAEGFIGSHLVECLVKSGADVLALSLYESFGHLGWLDSLPTDITSEIEVQRGDLRDPAHMRQLAAGRDMIFHLGALIAIPFSYVSVQSYIDVNIGGTANVLEAARWEGIERVIHTSTSEVYGSALFTPITEQHPLQAQSPYAASKIAADAMAEAYARSFDLQVVTMRPFNTFGPRQSERAVIPTIIRQAIDPACENIRIGDSSPKRDFTYVSDTADAFAAAGLAENLEYGCPYNLGAGHNISIGEVVNSVRTLTGCNKSVVVETERLRPKNSEVKELLADFQRFSDATGWSPKMTLEQGLDNCIGWWRSQFDADKVRRQQGYLV